MKSSQAEPVPDAMASWGLLCMGSRLRRLYDRIVPDVTAIYRRHAIAFEPRWFPLFRLIADRGEASVMEASERLGVSHPLVSRTARELEQAGLVSLHVDPSDRRRKRMTLTAQGGEMLERMRPVWAEMSLAIADLLGDDAERLLTLVHQAEESLTKSSLQERTVSSAPLAGNDSIAIEPYDPRWKHHFRRLNEWWVQTYFAIEPPDEQAFADPHGVYLEPGGEIFFARQGGRIVGTCALKPRSADEFELAKMGVDPREHGKGIGSQLMSHAIAWATERNAKRLVLETNSRLRSAIRLYERFGFQTVPLRGDEGHARVDRVMVKRLD
ncbi:putative N-acetyltransferase YsnE [Planctomycetes bacterium Pan216]|uniref:Putative N-acetyltransferase YsnE n=1 Tax=Kolteria novifilia TaxID=2527975 RepID=A0A518AX13_9BACT|nr:putative N-acetyltransferase YsnE [Planctomycetes bacterium Pan216]